MNKKILTLVSVILLVGVVLSSCRRRSGPLSCAASTVDYTQELGNYLGSQTKENCERVIKSIEDVYKSCSTPGSFDREELKEMEEDLNCDDL